ncbi:MAG: hypothetical protein QG566_551 [Patescibacteria group bacterium]|nr:hypothetical protein [Patescibacteria group bacterium]
MILISNKSFNYPFAVVTWGILFLILTFLLRMVDLTNPLWGLLALAGTGFLVWGTMIKIEPRQTVPLLYFGTQTGVSLSEGYYFLLFAWSLDSHEKIDLEYQDIIIPPFQVECLDKVLDFSFNAKIQFGKSNARRSPDHPHATPEEDADAKRRFVINNKENIPGDFTALLKSVCNMLYGNMSYSGRPAENGNPAILGVKGRNITQEIKLNDFFYHECFEWGIDPKNLLPFVQPHDMAQQNKDRNRVEITGMLKRLYPNLSDQELSRLVNLQLKDVNSKEYIIVGGGQPFANVRIDD